MQENILILGLGGIGSYLAKRLVQEGYQVTVIETKNNLIQHAETTLDARIISGNGMNIDCWKDADVQNMDYLIAVTDNDAVNMISSMIADRFGVANKIARVRSRDFGKKDSLLKGEDLHIDLFIHPEELVAQEIVHLIKRRAGNEIIDIALGQMQAMATRIDEESPLANKNLVEISQLHNEIPFRVVAVVRGIDTIIPGGDHTILPQDQVLIMANSDDLEHLMVLTGVKQQHRHRVMILGGGLLGSRIAELLGKTVQVKLIEKDKVRAQELSAQLKETEILHGDGSDKNVLQEAGLLEMDMFIATTGENETNIMCSILAKNLVDIQPKKKNRQLKTVCLVNNEDYIVLATTSGLDITLNKKILAANEILTYLRRSELLSVSHMYGFDAEVVDLIAARNSPITRKPLSKMNSSITGKLIVGSVFRDGHWNTAVGSTHIRAGDRVIVICKTQFFKDVQKLFLS